MAESLAASIGEALVALLDWGSPRFHDRLESSLERVAEYVRPDPPISIVTLDGHVLTGLLVADRGQVLAFLGTRQPCASSRHTSGFGYDDEPLWRHDSYGR